MHCICRLVLPSLSVMPYMVPSEPRPESNNTVSGLVLAHRVERSYGPYVNSILLQDSKTVFVFKIEIVQGIDGSAHKPALVQDTGYMPYPDIALYLGVFGAYLMPQ